MKNRVFDYRHIIWDWNGTLLDDVAYVVSVMNSLLLKRSMPALSLETYLEVFDFPVIDYYLRLGFDFSKESFESISDDFINLYTSSCCKCKLHEDVPEFLRSISAEGITQSVLSASHQLTLEEMVDSYNIKDYFIKLNGLDNHHAAGKVEIGKEWISRLDYGPDEILLIGDTTHDYQVSRAMGCDCVLVARGHHTRKRLEQSGAQVVSTLRELASCTFYQAG
jgi:phosphoglycolate phosphatase